MQELTGSEFGYSLQVEDISSNTLPEEETLVASRTIPDIQRDINDHWFTKIRN